MSTRSISDARRRSEAELLEALTASPQARARLDALLRTRTPAPPAIRARADSLSFSFMFFAGSAGGDAADQYDLLHDLARFGDAHGFTAVWIPERHFHPFGGIYPSPVVMAASLAKVTERIRLRAGSVVLPLHHPVTVTESWAMVDQLSRGRVDIAFASGWNPNDFVVAPEVFPRLREVWLERIEIVRRLWRGDELALPNGNGETHPIRIFPRPVQPELDVWLTITSRDDSFVEAGRKGYNVLTMLKGISVEELGRKVRLYREARAAAGHDPRRGVVTLMLHTLVHPDVEWVRRKTAESFGEYVKTGLSGHVEAVGVHERPDAAATQKIVEYASERYAQRAALFGTPADCRAMAEGVQAIGVNEIACLMDFGVDAESVKASLPHLLELKTMFAPPGTETRAAAAARPGVLSDHRATQAPVAVVGMSGVFPGSPDLNAFWTHLRDGHELIREIPPERQDSPAVTVRHAGLLDDIERFDAATFRITNREAASMDPHQRLFLETAWRAVEDAGYAPETLAGTRTGVFVAAYNPDFTVRVASGRVPIDSYTSTGTPLFMVANRVSHVLDLRGPSEVVNTACSSALVAIHRAVQAIGHGECDQAIVGGVSLLLSMGRLAGLEQYGILSPEGRCRPFDRDTTGQVIGEGAGALLLKPLAAAERDGNAVIGVIRGSAVNHHGNRSGSPTLPDVHAQADVIMDACRTARLSFADIDYIEAHGAGGFGDVIELEAFKRAETLACAASGAAASPARTCRIGTLKPNIGFLEAAGGISQAIKVLLMLRHGEMPPTLNHVSPPDQVELQATPFEIVTSRRPWTTRVQADGQSAPRRASVHSYGLGGTNAHVIFEEPAGARPWITETRITPDAQVVADHQVGGRPLVPAVAYLDLAAEACRPLLNGQSWRFENVFWLRPCTVEAETVLRCTVKPGRGSFFFEISLNATSGVDVLATGHVRPVAAPPAAPASFEDLGLVLRETTAAISEAGIYDAASSIGVQYGPAFRAVKEARASRDVVVATLVRPHGETADGLLSRGLLEGAFQSARLFAGATGTNDLFMPFSVGAINVRGTPVPESCQAIVRASAGDGNPQAGHFDAVLVADGTPWITIEDFCARRQRPAPVDVERTLADLAAGRLSLDEAASLLEGAAPLAASASSDQGLVRRLGAILTRLGREDQARDVTVQMRDGDSLRLTLEPGAGPQVQAGVATSGCALTIGHDDLAALVAGTIDPSVPILLGRLRFEARDEIFARDVGEVLFRHHNLTECAKRTAAAPLIGQIYTSGIVTAADGERRAIYPWSIPASVGFALHDLIRQRGFGRTLEIGMAYGLATLFMCDAHRERGTGHHTAIDPCQRLEFRGIGLLNMERAGLSPLLECIEEEDARALPDLERRGDRFDFVFIDGLHMFDYTLLDFFHADRLVRVGGCIAFDDALTPGVQRAIDFIRENRSYRAVDVGVERLVVLEKLEDDTRSLVNPNHHRDF